MGEAWFMAEQRKMYPELRGNLSDVPTSELQTVLVQIASGPGSFGQLAEWTEWCHYLLPRLIPRAHETFVSALLELILTAFFAQHPDSQSCGPYPGFRRDAVATLGRSLMTTECWPSGLLDVKVCLNKFYLPRVDRWRWDSVSDKLSASLFFCLKYLDADDVEPWLRSVAAIKSPQWRAQLLVWFVGAYDFLVRDLAQPSDINLDAYPDISWDWSHCLTGNYTGTFDSNEPNIAFLPPENRRCALAVARTLVSSGAVLEWIEAISLDPKLATEIGDLPGRFFDLFGASH